MKKDHGPDCIFDSIPSKEDLRHIGPGGAAELLVALAEGNRIGGAMADAMRAGTDREDPRLWKMAYLIKMLKHGNIEDDDFLDELKGWALVAHHVVGLLEAKQMKRTTPEGSNEVVH